MECLSLEFVMPPEHAAVLQNDECALGPGYRAPGVAMNVFLRTVPSYGVLSPGSLASLCVRVRYRLCYMICH
jgi:hypothetical protein